MNTTGEVAVEVLVGCVTRSVASTLATISAAPPRPEEVRDDDVDGEAAAGFLAFVGDVPFTCVLHLPREVAEGLVESFSGMRLPFDGDELPDAVGELLNVIAGEIVAEAERKGLRLRMGTPSVTRGRSLRPLPASREILRVAGFRAREGVFRVCVVAGRPSLGQGVRR
jgi:CheY-specific phosphatase CheX